MPAQGLTKNRLGKESGNKMADVRYRFNMPNVRYLRTIFGEEMVANFKTVRDADCAINAPAKVWDDFRYIDKCLKTMYCYGDVRWWESKNKYVVAYYQIHEPMLLVDFNKFKLALSSLLGRGLDDLVQDYEIFSERERLQKEVQDAFEIYMQTVDPDLVGQIQ